MNRFRWLSAILLTFIPIAYPSAQPPRTTGAGTPRLMAAVDPPLFRGLKYRLVGPSRGGRVTTVTGVPSQPHTFYIGVASGGLLRTTDGGTTWVPIADGKIPLGSMGHLRGHRVRRRSQQRVDRSRRLQDDRWRRDLAIRRPLQRGTDRRGENSSDQSQYRVGCCLRRCVQAQHRARRLQDG